jgi:uncharacterized repeat protein (TIGR03803 family)
MLTGIIGPRSGQHRRCVSALALVVMFVTAVIGTPAAQAQTYTVLHRFTGADGANPYAGLVGDSAGNLYGTTSDGGASGYGVVFKVNKTGETVLYSFTGGADGAKPLAGLIRDLAGNLYGTTFSGGASGYGVVFKLDTTGTETVLHSFTEKPGGANPEAGLIQDSAGNLYGTTGGGGASGLGVAFKLDTTGTEKLLHSFTGGADGESPQAGLIRDAAGNFSGTTYKGGGASGCGDRGCGVVFKLDTTGTETVLYSFPGTEADGAYPYSGLIRDSAGNLYGTTYAGGASHNGVVFKLDTTGTETVLYSFIGGVDGGLPYAGLTRDLAGNLYGTTYSGGASNNGVVFKLNETGETVLYSFTGGADGANPRAGLIRDSAGNLYGTTLSGGTSNQGVVFMLKP